MSIFNTIRKTGIRYSFGIAFNRIVPSWLFRIRRFNVYEMDPNRPMSGSRSDAVVRWATSEEEILNAEQLTGPQRNVDVGAEAMRVCHAKVDGKLAGAFWATSKVFIEDGLGIEYELSDEQAWLFAAYVDKSYRRHGVYSSILEFITPSLVASGKTQVLLAVNPDNIGSRKAHEKYAKRRLGSVVAIRFLSMAICWVRGDVSSNRWITWNHKSKPITIRFDRESSSPKPHSDVAKKL